MILAVGTTREPKVRAVRRSIEVLSQSFPNFLNQDLRLVARSTPSGAPDTPCSTAELMAGARHRAESLFGALRAEGEKEILSLGLEGGLVSEPGGNGAQRLYLLESWAYVTDGGRGFFGSSGCLPLPQALVAAVIDSGEDLGPAADDLYRQSNVAGRQGTFGILTGEVITREDAFVRAILHALAPFYNRNAYNVVYSKS
jgi:non-canonical (house-cleaning) NTP pyrophosphatase